MTTLRTSDPLATAIGNAIRAGDVDLLQRLLSENSELATACLVDERGTKRSLLHIATDWPGHFPNVKAVIAVLVAAGADVNACFVGKHRETPLHWAASSNDVDAIDALLDSGADIESPGAVLGGGSPLADATGFGQWNAARRLLERGARPSLFDAAALGLTDRVEQQINAAFWSACHGGQLATAKFLAGRGADINWLPPWERRTPLDAARRSRADDVVEWLLSEGAISAGG